MDLIVRKIQQSDASRYIRYLMYIWAASCTIKMVGIVSAGR